MRPDIKLGDKVTDRVSSYTGIVIGIHDWLNGCRRATVQAQELHDGKPVEAQCFDVEQIKVVESKAIDVMQPSGGPMPTPRRSSDPTR